MGSVTISGATYEVFGTLSGARVYHGGGASGGPFLALDATGQSRALVSATRMLSRVGLVDPGTGAAIVPSTVPLPVAVEQASYELALAVVVDPALLSAPASGSNVRRERIKADVVESETEYFVPTLLVFGRFPTAVQELIGPYLAGSLGAAGPEVSGATLTTDFQPGDFGFSGEGLP